MNKVERPAHEHDWYWSPWYSMFKCQWEDEDGTYCKGYISTDMIKAKAGEELVQYAGEEVLDEDGFPVWMKVSGEERQAARQLAVEEAERAAGWRQGP